MRPSRTIALHGCMADTPGRHCLAGPAPAQPSGLGPGYRGCLWADSAGERTPTNHPVSLVSDIVFPSFWHYSRPPVLTPQLQPCSRQLPPPPTLQTSYQLRILQCTPRSIHFLCCAPLPCYRTDPRGCDSWILLGLGEQEVELLVRDRGWADEASSTAVPTLRLGKSRVRSQGCSQSLPLLSRLNLCLSLGGWADPACPAGTQGTSFFLPLPFPTYLQLISCVLTGPVCLKPQTVCTSSRSYATDAFQHSATKLQPGRHRWLLHRHRATILAPFACQLTCLLQSGSELSFVPHTRGHQCFAQAIVSRYIA